MSIIKAEGNINFKEIENNLLKNFKVKTIQQINGLEDTIINLCVSIILNYFRPIIDETCPKNPSTLKKEIPMNGFNNTSSCSTIKSVLIHQDLIKERLSVIPKYNKMINLFLKVLEKNKYLIKQDNDQFLFTDKAYNYQSPSCILEKINIQYPAFSSFFNFLVECSNYYPQVLSGRIPPTAVLFPNGNHEKLDSVFKNTPKLGYEYFYLELLKEILIHDFNTSQYLQNQGNNSLIEVGSGQGILTEIIAPLLGIYIDKYTFTDISQVFVDNAIGKFGKENLDYKIFDINKDPDTQNISNKYQYVLGFNILHATPDINAALDQCEKVLAKGGKMMFVENIIQEVWIDMIYGLTEGWWIFNDKFRHCSPLLSKEKWQKLLNQRYDNFLILPSTEDSIHNKDCNTALIIIEP